MHRFLQRAQRLIVPLDESLKTHVSDFCFSQMEQVVIPTDFLQIFVFSITVVGKCADCICLARCFRCNSRLHLAHAMSSFLNFGLLDDSIAKMSLFGFRWRGRQRIHKVAMSPGQNWREPCGNRSDATSQNGSLVTNRKNLLPTIGWWDACKSEKINLSQLLAFFQKNQWLMQKKRKQRRN